MPNINTDTMSAITTEKARIIQQLSQVEVQGATLSGQLLALNSLEKVLLGRKTDTRRSSVVANKTATDVEKIVVGPAPKRSRGRPTKAKTDAPMAKSRGASSTSSLYNITLEAARARPGQTGAQITTWINETYKMSAQPQHVSAMLVRHAKYGRLAFSGEKKFRTWYEPTAMPKEKAA